MPYGLSDQTLHKLETVFEEYSEIEEAILFGSRAKGNFREGSDIDIALKGKNLNFEKLKKIEIRIDEFMLPYEVNLVLYDSITNSDLTDHIARAGVRIYKKEALLR